VHRFRHEVTAYVRWRLDADIQMGLTVMDNVCFGSHIGHRVAIKLDLWVTRPSSKDDGAQREPSMPLRPHHKGNGEAGPLRAVSC
jgi:hypothetical protein